jgi:hypothetical protein
LTPTALAARGDQIIRECLQHDRITGQYSQQDYDYALAHLPADVDEYSDCRDVIRRAKLNAAGGGGPAPGAPSATGRPDPLATATPAERKAVDEARDAGSQPVSVAGHLIRPGVIATPSSSVFNSLPGPLLAVLIALLAGGLAAAGAAILRVRARRLR